MNMDSNNVKRKKRKTRKCLNEMRKRSHRKSSGLNKENSPECDVKEPKGINKSNKYVTLNRITLSMFPKAVRSETITRPALAQIKHKENLNLSDIVKDKMPLVESNTNVNNDAHIEIDVVKYDTLERMDETENQTDDNSGNESPFGNFVLVSPVYQNNENSSSSDTEFPYFMTPSTSNFHDNKNSHLVKEFVKEFPKLLKKKFPELLHDDYLIKNMKSQVYNSDENDKSACKSIDNIKRTKSIDNLVIQNPIEYIKLAQRVKDDISSRNSSPVSSESVSCMHSPLILEGPSIVQETPEYKYYPHKLNQ